jgi:tellurite methyltransferase
MRLSRLRPGKRMSRSEQKRWDARWAAEAAAAATTPYEPHPLLVTHAALLRGGRALDLACGLGQNAIWLAEQGYEVLAVDISQVALTVAAERAIAAGVSGSIRWQRHDLDHWRPARTAFDLVCVFRFLDRRLFSALRDAVCGGGLLFYESRHTGALERQPQSNPAFLLQPGELARHFAGWEFIYSAEDPEKAFLVARRPWADAC